MAYDPLDFWSCYEFYLSQKALGQDNEAEDAFLSLKGKMKDYVQSYLELSLDYANAGLWEEAIDVLSQLYLKGNEESRSFPMVYYYLGYYWHMKGDEAAALSFYRQAAEKPPDYCFPFRLESIDILEKAIQYNPSDTKAPYYLGNLLYENQPEKAIMLWEQSKELDDTYPVVHRNLGLAYYKQYNDIQKATASYLNAVSLNHNDQRLLYELDLIYAAGREDPLKRLKLLQEHHEMIANNNVADALSREVMLLVQLGRYDEALAIAENEYFRQWEGVSKAYDSYVDAHLLRGWQHFNAGNYEQALEDYLAAKVFPDNMMVAESYRGGRLGQIYYFAGTAYEAMNNASKATEYYRLAADRREEEDLSDNHYYKALALQKLGRTGEADEIFDGLIGLGQQRLESQDIDFFAKFGERQTPDDRKSEAHYLTGLGYLGKDMDDDAIREFKEAVKLNINHIWAVWYSKEPE